MGVAKIRKSERKEKRAMGRERDINWKLIRELMAIS
jgi:hypothetical protein